MPYKYTTDLVNDALFRGGEPTDGSSDYASQIIDWINRGYQAIANGTFEATPEIRAPWWWLWSPNPGVVTLQPNVGLGSTNAPTASITQAQTGIVFSSPPKDPLGNNISVAGWYIKFVPSGATSVTLDCFKILSHLAGDTVAVLDSPYTGVTNPAAMVNIFNLEYNLPSDLMYIVAPLRAYQTGREQCEVVSKHNLETMFPLTQITFGIPNMAAFIAPQRMRFSHYVGQGTFTAYARLDFDYIIIPPILTGAMNEEPLMPINYRQILADYGLQQLLLAKNDDRAPSIGELLKNAMTGMYKSHIDRMNRESNSWGRIYPRQQDRASIRGPWRTESGYILGY